MEMMLIMFMIDNQSRVPIYEQIIFQIELFIAQGILKQNEQLPSVRQAASDSGINPNTIQKAYLELERQGYIYSAIGKGYYVSEQAKNSIELRKKQVYKAIDEQIDILKKLGSSVEDIKTNINKKLKR